MGLNGSVSLFSDMADTLTALNRFLRHFGWKEVTIISEIQETFLEVRIYMDHLCINGFRLCYTQRKSKLHDGCIMFLQIKHTFIYIFT